MYRVLIDRIPIHDPAVDDKKRLIHSGVVKQQVNSAASFEFTIYPDNPGYSEISILASDVEVWADEEPIFKGRPLKRVDGWSNEHKYICEGALAFFNDTIIRPYSYTGSVRGYLQKLITEHNDQVPAEKQFTLRNVTVTDPNDTIVRSSEEYVVTMKEIQEKAVGLLGGYLRIEYADSRWYLDYLADGVHGSGQEITISKNLIDFEREQNAQNIVTRLIPLGAKDETTGARLTIESVNGGLDYLDDAEAIAKYGIIAATEIWDDVTVAANLKTKALARLSDLTAIIPSLSLTAVDLSLTDSNIEPIRLLDYVTVSDEAHDASGSYLVMSRTYNISNPASDTVTFGGDQPKVSGTISKVAAKADALPAVVLRTASEQARQLLENASFGAIQMIYDENGIWTEMRINNSKNPDTATAYWVYNANGWGYFDGETYIAAGTADGALLANMIKAGILSSLNNVFYVNMDSGETLLGNATITGTVKGSAIIGSTFSAGRTITRYKADYSQSDIDRLVGILNGSITPTSADYEKLDFNQDGKINSVDAAYITDLVRGSATSRTIDATVTINGNGYTNRIMTVGALTKIGERSIETNTLTATNVNGGSLSIGSDVLGKITSSGGLIQVYGPNSTYYGDVGTGVIWGDNSNGCIRFRIGSSKVQIAWKQITWTGKLNHAWGSGIYESAAVLAFGSWYASFSAAPSVAYSANSSGNLTAWVAAGTIAPSEVSAGSVVLERVNASDVSQTWTVRAIAVGTYT